MKNKKIYQYISQGERNNFHNRETCKQNAQRKKGRWYDLDEISANILFSEYTLDRLATFYSHSPVFINNRLYGVYADRPFFLWCVLNSTVFHLFAELAGPQPGGGSGPRGIRVYDLKSILIPIYQAKTEKRFKEILKNFEGRQVLKIFEEIGASSPEEVSLNKIKPDRRYIDKIIMNEILNLNDSEQIEVYKAVIDLVKSRIEKAKSTEKQKKAYEEVDIERFKNNVINRIRENHKQ